MRKNKAFTILELLVVVAIIVILAVIAVPNFIGRIDDAKVSQELAEINAVTKAINTYYADKGNYPTLQGKDGTLLQPQPIDGSPHNIDFSSLVPEYLATLPHFSYWWVDAQGEVYHTQKALGTVTANLFTPTTGYTYTLYKTNGTTQVLSAPYTLLAGEYVIGKDSTGVELPKVSSAFKNALMHPQDPEYVTPVAPVTFTSQTFTFTGAVQSFTVPATGTYKLEVWGAQGGSITSNGYTGPYGGYSYGNKSLLAGQVINIYVGGKGVDSPNTYVQRLGGWNGGGMNNRSNYSHGSSGGGGTDIRVGGTALTNRIIVAGGGGGIEPCWGTANVPTTYGFGGGATGGTGYSSTSGGAGLGGTQTAGGSYSPSYSYAYAGTLGAGGDGNQQCASGGGGGYYGGGGAYGGNGGGGSGYIGGVTSGSMSAGVRSGNGQAKITYVGP